jgi:hypothetical protein
MDTRTRTRLEDHITDLTARQIADLIRYDDAVQQYCIGLNTGTGPNPLGALNGRFTTALTAHPELEDATHDRLLTNYAGTKALAVLGWATAQHGPARIRISDTADRVISELGTVIEALTMRDHITGEDYDLLTCVWRAAIGPLRQDQTPITDPVAQVWAPHVARLASETQS